MPGQNHLDAFGTDLPGDRAGTGRAAVIEQFDNYTVGRSRAGWLLESLDNIDHS